MKLNTWVDELRSLFEDTRSQDWGAHANTLNHRLGLPDDAAFSASFAGLPLFWFNGDVEAIRPDEWTMVVSLNHQLPSGKEVVTPETAWDFYRTHNRTQWYPRFFRPLVNVASTALGDVVARDDESEYATTRMVFVELCPYASRRFALGSQEAAALVATEPGFQVAARIINLLVSKASPRLILLNGARSVETFEARYADQLENLQTMTYPSVDSHGRTRWHKQGYFSSAESRRPVIGFPALRTMSSANSNAEVRQFGLHARDFLAR